MLYTVDVAVCVSVYVCICMCVLEWCWLARLPASDKMPVYCYWNAISRSSARHFESAYQLWTARSHTDCFTTVWFVRFFVFYFSVPPSLCLYFVAKCRFYIWLYRMSYNTVLVWGLRPQMFLKHCGHFWNFLNASSDLWIQRQSNQFTKRFILRFILSLS